MNQQKQKEFYYILNLTKARIFFISSSLIIFLSFVFLGGLVVGRFTKNLDEKSDNSISNVDNQENNKGVRLDLNTSPLRHSNPSVEIIEEPIIKKQKKKVKRYYIQVFATSNKEKAKNIYKNLKVRKYKPNIKIVNKSGKKIFIIRIGLYQKRARADRHLKVIRTKFPKAILRTV